MKIHFISIGGSVMHQLAIALHHKGYTVTGSDDEIFEPSRSNLAAVGLLPQGEGWNPDRVHAGLDAVLLGMHAHADNPELARAKELGIPVYSFPEYMYQESKSKTRVVVGGSHGKTTTTAMIMHALRFAQMDFDYLVGARIPGFEQSVRISHAPILVAEGDEYPASVVEKRPKFHFLFPSIAILTGIAWDHINVFPTWENYLEQFIIFLHKIEPGGLLIYNQTDEVLTELVKTHAPASLQTIGYSALPAKRVGDATWIDVEGHEAPILLFGDHNLLNMQAAWLVCRKLGVAPKVFANAMSSFKGAARRLEVLQNAHGLTIYRDFAHAPSKVTATLKAMVQQAAPRKVIAVLELHTYSSLNKAFLPHYANALDGAYAACVFFSQHALQIKRLPALDATDIVAGFAKPDIAICHTREQLEQWLLGFDLKQNQLLLMSSGTFDGLDLQQLGAPQ